MFRSPRLFNVGRQQAGFAAFIATFAGIPLATHAAEETWIAHTDALWSLDAAWLDGTAPLLGGASDLILRFLNEGSNAYTATNDLGAPFVFNRLVLSNDSTGVLSINSVSGSRFEAAGESPGIEFTGHGRSEVKSQVSLNASNGRTTISGAGWGTLTFSQGIREQTPGQILVINAPAPSLDTHFVDLDFGSFTGGFILEAGNVLLRPGGLGLGPVTINGGTLRGQTVSGLNNSIFLNADLQVMEGGDFTLSGVISSSVSGTGLTYRNSNNSLSFRTLALTAASTFDGPTILDYSPIANEAVTATSELKLSGAGSVLNSSAIHVRADAMLRLEATNGANNRVGDSTPVHLRSAELLLAAPGSVSGVQTEAVGTLTVAGHSTVTAQPGSAAGAVFTAQSLSRLERGTVLFRGSALGVPIGVNVGNVLFTVPPGGLIGGGGSGPQTSILPYAIGSATNTGVGTGFVTYDSVSGIRPLNDATDYTTNLGASGPAHNVRIATSAVNDAALTLNALVTGAAPGSLGGSGVLTLASGALLNLGSAFAIANDLAFGGREAVVFTVGPLTISGVISGSGGLTKSSAGTLTLSGANTFTGPLTINGGTLTFSAAENLGSDASPIVLNATTARLTYTGQGLTLSRPIEMRTGVGTLSGPSVGGRLIAAGTISGPGGMRTSGRVTLAAANTYTGPTFLGGEVIISADSAFGSGGELELANATLTLAGDWATSRRISANSRATLNTGGFTAAINGALTGTGGFTKTGAGAVRLTSASPLAGPLAVNGGVFELLNEGSLFSTSLSAASGGELRLDNSALSVGDRILDHADVSLDGGWLTLIGHGPMAIDERIGAIKLNGSGGNIVTVRAPGAARTVLTIGALVLNGGDVLFRGERARRRRARGRHDASRPGRRDRPWRLRGPGHERHRHLLRRL